MYTPHSAASGTTQILEETRSSKVHWESGSACRMCNALIGYGGETINRRRGGGVRLHGYYIEHTIYIIIMIIIHNIIL